MEKIFQILIVFALLVFAISRFLRGKERRYREYSFSGRFTFPMSGEAHRDLLTAAVMRPGEDEVTVSWAGMEERRDAENHLIFRRGGGKTMEIIDEANGILAGRVSLDWDADVILFDPHTRLIYCGSIEGAVTIIRQFMPDQYKIVQRLAVPQDCTALSIDPYNGKLYVHVGMEVSVYANA